MKGFPLLTIAVIFSAAAMFGLFCFKVPAGSMRLNFKVPGVNLEAEVRKEENQPDR